jgi:hypothetical protein
MFLVVGSAAWVLWRQQDNFTEYLLNITYGENYSLHGKTEIKQAYLDECTLKCVTGESCEESCDLWLNLNQM